MHSRALSYQISWRFVEKLLSYGDLTLFQHGSYPPSCILKIEILSVVRLRSMYVIVQNFMAIGQTVPEIWWFFGIFKMATVRHLGFIMSMFGQHTEYVVVFIIVQNFVGIDAVVSIICKYWYLASLAWKCLFKPARPQIGVFLGRDYTP